MTRPELTVEDYGDEPEIVYSEGEAPRPVRAVIGGQPYRLIPSMIPMAKRPRWARLFGRS